MQQALTTAFPRNARVQHRVILTIARRQFVFNGHLTIQATGAMRLVVLGPMGRVADLVADADGKIDVKQHHPKFRERWVKRYIARDMQLLCAAPDSAQLAAARTPDGTLILEHALPDTPDVHRYTFGDNGATWEALSVYRKGRRTYHAVVEQTRQFSGWNRAMPSSLKVQAKQYQLDITIVDVRPLSVATPPDSKGASSNAVLH